MEADNALKQKLVQIIHAFNRRGWSMATSTNYSVRSSLNPKNIFISQSGKDKEFFNVDDFMTIDLQGHEVSKTQARPSAETSLHLMLYKNSHINCVLHTHSVEATYLSLLNEHQGGLSFKGLEMIKSLRNMDDHLSSYTVPIFSNSQNMPKLAEEISSAERLNVDIHCGFLLAGHGLYCFGESLEMTKRYIEGHEFLFKYLTLKEQI